MLCEGIGIQKVQSVSESVIFTLASLVNRSAISELRHLWKESDKKVSPSFVSAISVSGECDTRGRVSKNEV